MNESRGLAEESVRKGLPGFYYLSAVVVGMCFTGVVARFEYLQNPAEGNDFLAMSPKWQLGWFLLAALASNVLTAFAFRRHLVMKRKPLMHLLMAGAIGYANVLIFSLIAGFGLLAGYLLFPGVLLADVVIPLSIVAYFLMRWADKLDRNSVWRKGVSPA